MGDAEIGLALYWAIGFIGTVALVRHVNRGLSILDFFACAIVATIWPLTAAIALAASAIYKAPWLTEARYLRSRKSPLPSDGEMRNELEE